MFIHNAIVTVWLIMYYLVIPILVWVFARKTRVGKVAFSIYIISFIVVLFFGITSRVSIGREFTSIDIDFTSKWCEKTINLSFYNVDFFDFCINIIMLIPIGLVVVFFHNKSIVNMFVKLFIIGVISGSMLETIQFVLPVYRSVQLSDMVLNTISVLIGGVNGLIYDKIFNNKQYKKS